jgi:hypothetical protein
MALAVVIGDTVGQREKYVLVNVGGLFDAHWQKGRAVYLLGVQISGLGPERADGAAGRGAREAPQAGNVRRWKRCVTTSESLGFRWPAE